MGGSSILNYGVYSLLFLILTMAFFLKSKTIEYNKKLSLLAILFTCAQCLSAIYNSDLNLMINGITFLILFLSTTVIANTYLQDTIGKVVTVSLLLAHIPIILIPIRNGIDYFPYKGIFNNSNAFGLVAATVFATLLAILLSSFEKSLFSKDKPMKFKILVTFLLTTLCFLLIVISGSRTSFLAGIFSIIIGFTFVIFISFKYRLTINSIFKIMISVPFLWVFYFIINKVIHIDLYIENIIISKFDAKSENVLSGRGQVWEQTLSESKILGYGEGYFNAKFGIGAHNTFIHVLGTYGWLATIIFILLIIIAFYYCIRFAFSRHEYKYLPIIMITTFITLSMGENLFHKAIFFATFLLIGLASNNRKFIITK